MRKTDPFLSTTSTTRHARNGGFLVAVIVPHAVAERAGGGFYRLITKMSALLPKRVV